MLVQIGGIDVLEAIAKHLGRPIHTGCKLIENVLLDPTKALGGMLGDQVPYWQWSNRLRIAEKAYSKLEQKGISVKALPPDFAIPLIRECGDTEDPDLQEWWAELLARAIADDSNARVAFVHTMKELSPSDVKFMNGMLSLKPMRRDGRVEAIATATGLTIPIATSCFHNFERLGFFSPTASKLKGFAYDFLATCYSNPERLAAFRVQQSKFGNHIVTD